MRRKSGQDLGMWELLLLDARDGDGIRVSGQEDDWLWEC